MAKDNMALTLNGTTRWPAAKGLQRVGETRTQSTPSRIKMLFEQIAEALSDTAEELRKYVTEHPEFKDVGEAMLQEWETGRDLSLKVGNPTPVRRMLSAMAAERAKKRRKLVLTPDQRLDS